MSSIRIDEADERRGSAAPSAAPAAVATSMPVAALSVVVTTRNATRTLARCLTSLARSPCVAEIIVVDNHSTDGTREMASALATHVLTGGPERSAQRNLGLRAASGDAVAFLDADMVAEPGVLRESLEQLHRGADAVILSERSDGEGYWAAVRAFERRCYLGDDDVEACRVFRTAFVRELGGFDENLTAFEDWDLTLRARAAGAMVGRTTGWVVHDEGRLRLATVLGKKRYYAQWEAAFRAKHPAASVRSLSPFRRLGAFTRDPAAMISRPDLIVGLFVLKTVEYVGSRRAAAMGSRAG